ncbi:MAG: hypothetical protein A3I02_14870 [Betaproteobacteria bacterium RIFCSPLOWO2_02_FULL_67_26]|nr:MAG: hypothetical protein A3I02_14870 [Betaproteobacteria bacterium RIFCSPLOWO2_02_FULL_67_26]
MIEQQGRQQRGYRLECDDAERLPLRRHPLQRVEQRDAVRLEHVGADQHDHEPRHVLRKQAESGARLEAEHAVEAVGPEVECLGLQRQGEIQVGAHGGVRQRRDG